MFFLYAFFMCAFTPRLHLSVTILADSMAIACAGAGDALAQRAAAAIFDPRLHHLTHALQPSPAVRGKPRGLRVALAWWIPGMLLVLMYSVFIYRHFSGKVRLEEDGY